MKTHYEILPDIQKIAVLRANALGDFIFALPALEALRAAYPQSEIVYLGKEWHKQFLAHRPSPVDHVIVVPPTRGVGELENFEENAAEQEAFFSVMKQEHFDLGIQMHGGGRYSNPFLLNIGARMNVGLKTPDAVSLDRVVPYIYFQREVVRYLEVVSLVGATTTVLEPRITVTEYDLAEAQRIVPDQQKPLVVLHPGAGHPQRRWPPEKFAAVGDALAAHGAHVVVTGIEPDYQLVKTVVDNMQFEAQNLCGKLSLNGLAGLLSRSSVVISNDSGPLHLAEAVGAATVGLYLSFNLITAGPITRTRHRPHVSWRLECPLCGSNCTISPCNHKESFAADIPADEVIDSALDLLCSEQYGTVYSSNDEFRASSALKSWH